MPRGGKRDGAGRKPRHVRYDKDKPFYSKRALKIGLWCEMLWGDSWKHNFFGFHRTDDKRPQSARKRIVYQASKEFGETERMIETLWDDYRRFLADSV